MSAVVLRGDAAHLSLPDESADLIVTSPPYFGLRSYTDGGEHYANQIGSEATPAEYVAALIDCTREWVRVLKPSGSMFINLGDKYCAGTSAGRPSTSPAREFGGLASGQAWHESDQRLSEARAGVRTKSLIGLPWRYALACVDQLGLILRAEIIWSKPNGLPESVTDRVRRSHEQVFHFTRLPRYYSAVDEVREEHITSGRGSDWQTRREHLVSRPGYLRQDDVLGFDNAKAQHALGKLPGSVWDIASQPLTVPPELGVDHFAAFPMELPRRIILGWSPPGICTACGEGRRPVPTVHAERLTGSHGTHRGFIDGNEPDGNGRGINAPNAPRLRHSVTIAAYSCGCGTWPLDAVQPSIRPAVVLDPFGGTGTTALLADTLGRTGISIDRSTDYCRLARWRTTDPGERAKAMQVPKPPPQSDGQDTLFAIG